MLRTCETLYEIYAADRVRVRFVSFYGFTFGVHQMNADTREKHGLAAPTDDHGCVSSRISI